MNLNIYTPNLTKREELRKVETELGVAREVRAEAREDVEARKSEMKTICEMRYTTDKIIDSLDK